MKKSMLPSRATQTSSSPTTLLKLEGAKQPLDGTKLKSKTLGRLGSLSFSQTPKKDVPTQTKYVVVPLEAPLPPPPPQDTFPPPPPPLPTTTVAKKSSIIAPRTPFSFATLDYKKASELAKNQLMLFGLDDDGCEEETLRKIKKMRRFGNEPVPFSPLHYYHQKSHAMTQSPLDTVKYLGPHVEEKKTPSVLSRTLGTSTEGIDGPHSRSSRVIHLIQCRLDNFLWMRRYHRGGFSVAALYSFIFCLISIFRLTPWKLYSLSRRESLWVDVDKNDAFWHYIPAIIFSWDLVLICVLVFFACLMMVSPVVLERTLSCQLTR